VQLNGFAPVPPADSSAEQIPGKKTLRSAILALQDEKCPTNTLVHHVMTVATLHGRTIVSRMLKEWPEDSTASDRRCDLLPM
jgi:hypothetical protein